MVVAIIFGGFENKITIWQSFNLELLLEATGWGSTFFPFGDYSVWPNLLIF